MHDPEVIYIPPAFGEQASGAYLEAHGVIVIDSGSAQVKHLSGQVPHGRELPFLLMPERRIPPRSGERRAR